MTLAEYNAPIIKRAYDHGAADGRNAAEWFIQDAFGGRHTGDSKAAAAEVLRQLEDGDPVIWDSANVPDLSGEYADSMSTRRLSLHCAGACGVDHDAISPEEEDDLASNYEDGARDAWAFAVEKAARECVED
jgi:hypothetical protein